MTRGQPALAGSSLVRARAEALAALPLATFALALVAVGGSHARLAAQDIDPRAAAVLSVERWLSVVEQGGDLEARKTLLVALELAGDEGVEALLAELGRARGESRAAFACWALGQALRPKPLEAPRQSELRARAVVALREALSSPHAEVRLASASSLGLMEARAAEGDLLELLLSPGLTLEAEDVLLLSLAGLRGRSLSMLEARLERGGGESWAAATTASFLRWGGEAWPELLRFADESPDARVRAAALTSLLLLAEPASACGLAELYGREPLPLLRRVLLQALATTRHPGARDFLWLVARSERDPRLREMARLLSEGLLRERDSRRDDPAGPQRPVPTLLGELERSAGFARQIDEIEARAAPLDAELIAVVLRRLPLREDDRRLDDHARLAQVRARLLCLDGIDCASE